MLDFNILITLLYALLRLVLFRIAVVFYCIELIFLFYNIYLVISAVHFLQFCTTTTNNNNNSLCYLGRVENLLFGTSQLSVHWQTLMLPQLPVKLVQ